MTIENAFTTVITVLNTWTNDQGKGLGMFAREAGSLAEAIVAALIADGHLSEHPKASRAFYRACRREVSIGRQR